MDRENVRYLGYNCPENGEHYQVDFDKVEILPDYSECDLCGDHGSTTIEFPCLCDKKYHVIEVAVH